MPGKKRAARRRKASAGKVNVPLPPEEKIARILGVLAVKDIEQKQDQVVLLRAVGFDISEVAAMLRMSDNYVKVAAFRGRKGQRRRLQASNKK